MGPGVKLIELHNWVLLGTAMVNLFLMFWAMLLLEENCSPILPPPSLL